MKRLFKKNQMIITTLALMIAIAGYLNYSGRIFGDKEDKKTEANADIAGQELLDISDEDLATDGEIKSQDNDVADGSTVDGTPGEAVLTSSDVKGVVAEAKVNREQVRAKNKESLLKIIDSDKVTEEQKQDAIAQMIRMTEMAEKEVAAETMLASKGFAESVVSMSDEGADVVVNSSELSDANRAQIEDIVTRKTGVAPENVVITPIHSENSKAKSNKAESSKTESGKTESSKDSKK